MCISAGSACAASAEKPSHVISALGIPKEKAYGTIRITIGHENTRKEIDYTVEKLKSRCERTKSKKLKIKLKNHVKIKFIFLQIKLRIKFKFVNKIKSK